MQMQLLLKKFGKVDLFIFKVFYVPLSILDFYKKVQGVMKAVNLTINRLDS